MQLRPANQNDFNFIASTYLRGYRKSPAAKFLINDYYFDVYTERLKTMLKHGSAVVACSDDNEDDIFGYILSGKQHGKSVVHYVYVKRAVREQGVAKTLLIDSIPEFGRSLVFCTHTCQDFDRTKEKYKLIYTPESVK